MNDNQNERDDPSDVFRSAPVPPEVLAEFRRTFNEEELLREIREAEASGWYKLEDFIGELEEIARRADGSTSREG